MIGGEIGLSVRDYLKMKVWLITTYYMGLLFMIVVITLSIVNEFGFISFKDIAYGLLLATFVLSIYLVMDYRKKRKFLDILVSRHDCNRDISYIFDLPEGIAWDYDIIRKSFIDNYSDYIFMLNKYEENQKLVRRFNNRWIHEMKTPVSVMKLILEANSYLDKKEKISLEEEVEKLSNGLEMALHTLRINDFNLDFRVENVNLTELVRMIINGNKASFILNSVFPKMSFQENIFVKTDKKWIKFVINQLIINGIKYTKIKDINEKQIKIDIIDDGDVVLKIKDNGIGINKGDYNRIFEAFYTGRTGRKHLESTGMGLYLAKIVLDRLGHNIIVKSKEGNWTEFSIYFKKLANIYELED